MTDFVGLFFWCLFAPDFNIFPNLRNFGFPKAKSWLSILTNPNLPNFAKCWFSIGSEAFPNLRNVIFDMLVFSTKRPKFAKYVFDTKPNIPKFAKGWFSLQSQIYAQVSQNCFFLEGQTFLDLQTVGFL